MKFSFKKATIFILVLVQVIFFIPFASASTSLSSSPVNLPIFLIIGGFCLLLIFIGMLANIPFFTIVGFILLIFLGGIVEAGNLYVPSGVTGNFTSSAAVYTTDYIAYNTGNYHTIGFLIMWIGIIASVFSVFATFGGRTDG